VRERLASEAKRDRKAESQDESTDVAGRELSDLLARWELKRTNRKAKAGKKLHSDLLCRRACPLLILHPVSSGELQEGDN
jgi:hypothetical protein